MKQQVEIEFIKPQILPTEKRFVKTKVLMNIIGHRMTQDFIIFVNHFDMNIFIPINNIFTITVKDQDEKGDNNARD